MSACFAVPGKLPGMLFVCLALKWKKKEEKEERRSKWKDRLTSTSVRVRSGWKLKRYVPTTEWIISIRNAVEEGKEIFLFVLSRQDIQLIPFVIPFKIFLYF